MHSIATTRSALGDGSLTSLASTATSLAAGGESARRVLRLHRRNLGLGKDEGLGKEGKVGIAHEMRLRVRRSEISS